MWGMHSCPMFNENTPKMRCAGPANLSSYTCASPNIPWATICFVGDSLARQFMIHTACTWGIEHHYDVRQDENKRYVFPMETKTESGMRLMYSDLHCHTSAVDRSIRKTLGGCTHILLSTGAWNIEKKFAMSPSDFRVRIRNIMRQFRRVVPSAKLILKEMWAWGTGTRCGIDDPANLKIVEFNGVLRALTHDDRKAHFLGSMHNVSVQHNCDEDHPSQDPVHWCHRGSHTLDGAVCVLGSYLDKEARLHVSL